MKDVQERCYEFSKIKAIIGLGNPGARYEKTRHNIGFRVLDLLCAQHQERWGEKGEMVHVQLQLFSGDGVPRTLHLVKPQTVMNNSGRVISFLLKKGITGDEILVVHDELEKPFGKLAIRWNGSPRGHNGLRSIQGVTGKGFWRLRFGIGRPEEKHEVGTYVLRPFLPAEETEIESLLSRAIELIERG